MEFSDPIQFWLLIASVAGIAFVVGRSTAGDRGHRANNSFSQSPPMTSGHEAADLEFSSLSSSKQMDVDRLLREGKLIKAIKIVREETGLGLKEAKDVAEHRRRSLRGDQPT